MALFKPRAPPEYGSPHCAQCSTLWQMFELWLLAHVSCCHACGFDADKHPSFLRSLSFFVIMYAQLKFFANGFLVKEQTFWKSPKRRVCCRQIFAETPPPSKKIQSKSTYAFWHQCSLLARTVPFLSQQFAFLFHWWELHASPFFQHHV